MSTPNAEIQPMPPPPPPPPVANLEIETIVDGAETREDADANPYMPKKRKKTSPVWADFKEITLPNGQVKAECINVATELISGSEYPTANLFLPELVHIKLLLKEHEVVESEPIKSEVELIEGEGEVEPIEGVVEKDAAENESGTTYMQNMVKKMKKKFDKYWGSCNLLISMAAALDPRNKMKYIEWCADNVYSEVEGLELKVTVRETLRSLYDEYLEAYKAKFISDSADTQIACHGSSKSAATTKSKGRKMRSNYKTYMESVDNVDEIRSELDIYFEEGVVVWNDEEGAEFDAILWWKSNNLKFRILSKMACDVLSIPITTVASESAFSAGGRVIDPHRASLGVDTVQLLLCTEDWLRASYGIKRKAKDKKSFKEIYLT